MNEDNGGRRSALGGNSAGLHCNAKAESGSQDTHLKEKRLEESTSDGITTQQTGRNSPTIRPHPEWDKMFSRIFHDSGF